LQAQKTFDKPVMVVRPEEAEANENSKSRKQKTWQFEAKNVRDFAFASSRKFIYDMMAVKLDTKTVMAVSMYPKEAQPLWEEFSTRTVANTLKVYSKHLFDYPYHKAISVNAFRQGMEYPMICWNYGRPDKNGKISNRTKTGMINVITHEVGHNWFPMIVNSDERQWMWMDEGLNTFTELLAEQAFEKEIGFPLNSRGLPKQIVPFMKGDQSKMHPIMVNSDLMYNRGMTAYSKPAAGLYMLREVIMGHEAFDYAFKTYANRWKFKHPEPADFFRTMEDASAVDLDWFWRGWFFTTRANDMAIKKVEKFYVTDKPTVRIKRMAMMYGMKVEDFPPFVSLVTEDSQDFTPDMKSDESFIYRATKLKDFLNENFSRREIANLKTPKYFYRVVFEQKGELVMPIVVKITYKDGSTEQKIFPAKVWRFNNAEVSKMIPSTKEITKIEVDPENLTADIDMTNNTWPKLKASSEFDEIKKTIKK
jgi:aminopeptidase N